MSGVRCQVSGVTCQVSGVTYFFFFFYKVVGLVGRGSTDLLSTGPTPSSFSVAIPQVWMHTGSTMPFRVNDIDSHPISPTLVNIIFLTI